MKLYSLSPWGVYKETDAYDKLKEITIELKRALAPLVDDAIINNDDKTRAREAVQALDRLLSTEEQ